MLPERAGKALSQNGIAVCSIPTRRKRSTGRPRLRPGERSEVYMAEPVEALILDLLDWLTVRDRTYEEVMSAWRTSCPRLPVWEDANERGLIRREEVNGDCVITLTEAGLALPHQRANDRSETVSAQGRR